MPEFSYVAMDSRGKETKGKLEVADQTEAIGRLKSMGYFPTHVELARLSSSRQKHTAYRAINPPTGRWLSRALDLPIPAFGARVNSKSLVSITRQLARLVDSGLPLLRGLRLLERQEKNPTLRRVVNDLAVSIESGSTFSEALAQHPKIFNHLSLTW